MTAPVDGAIPTGDPAGVWVVLTRGGYEGDRLESVHLTELEARRAAMADGGGIYEVLFMPWGQTLYEARKGDQ